MIKKALIILVLLGAAGVGVGFYLGWFNWQDVRDRATSRETWADIKTRAQVQEANLKAKVNQLTGEKPVNEDQAAAICRQNLRRIESAKRAVASRLGIATGSVSWDQVLKEMGGKMPKCPKGGEYTLGTLDQLPRCSIGANGTPDTKDDHLIRSY